VMTLSIPWNAILMMVIAATKIPVTEVAHKIAPIIGLIIVQIVNVCVKDLSIGLGITTVMMETTMQLATLMVVIVVTILPLVGIPSAQAANANKKKR